MRLNTRFGATAAHFHVFALFFPVSDTPMRIWARNAFGLFCIGTFLRMKVRYTMGRYSRDDYFKITNASCLLVAEALGLVIDESKRSNAKAVHIKDSGGLYIFPKRITGTVIPMVQKVFLPTLWRTPSVAAVMTHSILSPTVYSTAYILYSRKHSCGRT